jgi:hypothetical protein
MVESYHMKTVQPRNDPMKIFWRRVRLAGLFGVVVFASAGVWDIYKKESESLSLRTQAAAALADLSQHQTRLQGDIRKLESDRGMEGAVRDQYQMGKQGEGMIVIVDRAAPASAESTSTSGGFFHKLMPWW